MKSKDLTEPLRTVFRWLSFRKTMCWSDISPDFGVTEPLLRVCGAWAWFMRAGVIEVTVPGWMVNPNPSTALFKQSGLWGEASLGLCLGRINVLNLRTEYSGLVPCLALVVTHELCPNKVLCPNMHDQDSRTPFQRGLLVITLNKWTGDWGQAY